jgi:type I restriction enzyme S subunit
MEVKTNYTNTEVGFIPEDWDVSSLENKIEISHGFAFKSKHFVANGAYRLATPGHFHEEGGFRQIGEKQKYYDGPVPPGYVLQPGDLIIAMTEQAEGLLGSAALIPEEGNYLHNQRLGKVRTKSNDVELEFLYYVFNSKYYRLKVRETAAGTKVKHTSPQKLAEIRVALPPRPEQRAIADALSDVDALIERLDALIAKKRALKTATMQRLLTGQQRLPGFSAPWTTKRLGALGSTYGGLTGKTKKNFGTGSARYVPFLNIMNNVTIDLGQLEKVEVFEGERQNAIQKGDLFFNTSSETPEEVGMCSTLQDNVENVYLNSFCFGFRLYDESGVDNLFLTYLFRSKVGRELIYSLAQGATRYNLSKSNFVKLEIDVPSPEEQRAIATILADMDAEIEALQARRDKTQAIKQGMMQELLTGRTRLV